MENTKKHVNFHLKVPTETWDRFRIKSIKDKNKTYNKTLLTLIDNHISEGENV